MKQEYFKHGKPCLKYFIVLFPIGKWVPYIGKSVNVLARYTKIFRKESRLKTVVSGIDNKDLLRAVEQRMINYIRTKAPRTGNQRNVMKKEDYDNYKEEVGELLKDFDCNKALDKYFNF